jgi:hypothetical protein
MTPPEPTQQFDRRRSGNVNILAGAGVLAAPSPDAPGLVGLGLQWQDTTPRSGAGTGRCSR